LQQGRCTEAVDLLRQTLAEPGLLPAAEETTRVTLAAGYGLMGEPDSAEKVLRDGLAKLGDDPVLTVGLAEVFARQRRFSEGEAVLRRLIDRPTLPVTTAEAVRGLEQLDRARAQDYQRQIEKAVRNFARTSLGGLYLTRNEPERAAVELEQVL